MTRKQEIIQAVLTQEGVNTDKEMKCFVLGAEWADSHSVNQWRKAEDERGERIRKGIIKSIMDLNSDWLELHGVTKEDAIAWLEKQGEQKSVDKVEPKFKVGDWVVTDLFNIVQIKAIDNDKYVLEDTMRFSISVDYADNCWHRWTIQDAKDGDMLVYGDNPNHNHVEVIMIFKSVRNERSVFTHFHIFIDQFRINDWCNCGESTHPATKEQRDLLFTKMKEKGYEWNKDKKKLIKL